MNSRNHRIEKQIQTDEFIGPNGETITTTYVASERTVYEADCPQCGREHTVKSFSQMLLKDRCLECLKNNAKPTFNI